MFAASGSVGRAVALDDSRLVACQALADFGK
jgi:hypothetical protein